MIITFGKPIHVCGPKPLRGCAFPIYSFYDGQLLYQLKVGSYQLIPLLNREMALSISFINSIIKTSQPSAGFRA